MQGSNVVRILKIMVIVLLIAVFSFISVLIVTDKNDYLGLLNHSDGAIYEINYFKAEKKKAMLLIPGLMASTLYDKDTGKALWGYDGIISMLADIIKIQASNATMAEKEEFLDNIINRLACDENNVPKLQERVGTMKDSDAYGAFNGMKYIYDILKPLYGKQYDIIVWQYDWRQSNTGSAYELEKFIGYHGYEEVMFFTHSMGGVVVANYLARSEENRDKVKLFMPFGCPLLGSMDAVNNLYESEDQAGIIASALSMVKDMFNTDFSLLSLARNMASVYELLPFGAFDETPYFDSSSIDYISREKTMYYEGNAQANKNMLSKMYELPWAKKENGELKPAVERLEKYVDNLYVDVNGVKTFVTDLVPTEYIVGMGLNTMVSVNINSQGQITEKIYSLLGDGTVPAYSASAGHSLNDDNVHLVYGIAHGPLANGEDLEGHTVETTGLKYVRDIMKKYIEKVDNNQELGDK